METLDIVSYRPPASIDERLGRVLRIRGGSVTLEPLVFEVGGQPCTGDSQTHRYKQER